MTVEPGLCILHLAFTRVVVGMDASHALIL